MKAYLLFILSALLFIACTEKQKKFAGVSSGMTKEEVTARVGEPSQKRDILLAELWVYDTENRTIVFRSDTVYDIITSADARVDSIGASIKEAGRDVKDKLESAGDTVDSASLRIRNKIMDDTLQNN